MLLHSSAQLAFILEALDGSRISGISPLQALFLWCRRKGGEGALWWLPSPAECENSIELSFQRDRRSTALGV